MMDRHQLTDNQWELMHEFLRTHTRVYVGNPDGCRRFLEGVLWILRSGSQWRSLPPRYGQWNSVFKRYDRWVAAGIWEALFAAVRVDADLQEGFIDSTVVRAHAAGAEKVMPPAKHSDAQGAVLAVKSMR